jgi:transposase
MSRNLFWLTDEQWAKIAPLLPTDVRGKARVDDRRVISGILHVLKSGCRWCDCPPEYGPPTTIYNRFVRWAKRGVWERMFEELSRRGRSAETQMIDSTHIKAHRSAAGGKGGSKIRRSDARVAGAIRKYMLSLMPKDVFFPSNEATPRRQSLRQRGTEALAESARHQMRHSEQIKPQAAVQLQQEGVPGKTSY